MRHDLLGQERIFTVFGIEAYPAAYAYAVRIRDDAGNSVNVSEQEVCDLPADSGQRQKFIYRVRQFPSEVVPEHSTCRFQRGCLGSVQAARFHGFFKFVYVRVGDGVRCRIFYEQIPADRVDSCVGALRGQPPHDEQLPGLMPLESALRSGI